MLSMGIIKMDDDLKIDVLDCKEMDDGSAILTLELSKKAVEIFVNIGIISVLKAELSRISDEE
jgi:hypothetical protein